MNISLSFCSKKNVRFVLLCVSDIAAYRSAYLHACSENARRNAFVDFKNGAEIVFVRKTQTLGDLFYRKVARYQQFLCAVQLGTRNEFFG